MSENLATYVRDHLGGATIAIQILEAFGEFSKLTIIMLIPRRDRRFVIRRRRGAALRSRTHAHIAKRKNGPHPLVQLVRSSPILACRDSPQGS